MNHQPPVKQARDCNPEPQVVETSSWSGVEPSGKRSGSDMDGSLTTAPRPRRTCYKPPLQQTTLQGDDLMRTTIAATLAALAVAPAAQAHDKGTAEHRNHWLRAEVVKLHGKRAPGCNLVALKCREHPHPTRRTIHRYLDTLRRQLMPAAAAAYVSSGRPWQPPAGAGTINAGPTLENIAACESGGDPTAIGGGGRYRGKYQFDKRTWASVGGSGDPAAASEAEQDKRAAILYAQRGSAPWPVCG